MFDLKDVSRHEADNVAINLVNTTNLESDMLINHPNGDLPRGFAASTRPFPTQRAMYTTSTITQRPVRFAVIGGGFAGLALTWHLLRYASQSHPLSVDLFDAYGLGAGGSGAAAGLIHPFNPKGRILWRGVEAFEDALRLVDAAEQWASEEPSMTGEKFVWRQGLIRPSKTAKQAKSFSNAENLVGSGTERAIYSVLECLDSMACAALVPGLASSEFHPAGLWIPQGVVVRPHSYLQALWGSCQKHPWGRATFRKLPVHSLLGLETREEAYDAIIVATGAAVHTIEEISPQISSQLDLCQGYSLDMRGPNYSDGKGGRKGIQDDKSSPSLLGSPYIAFHGDRAAVVGATQQHNVSESVAWKSLGPFGVIPVSASGEGSSEVGDYDSSEVLHAVDQLLEGAAAMWPRIKSWNVANVRSGVRAIPPRSPSGSIPLAGRLPSPSPKHNWWMVTGLGSRGLVYHGWLGRLLASSVWNNDEKLLPLELLRWKEKLKI